MKKKLKDRINDYIMRNILFTCPGSGKITEEEAKELLKYVDECFDEEKEAKKTKNKKKKKFLFF